jgi:uncharacterized protein YdaU (DUF1376 family)
LTCSQDENNAQGMANTPSYHTLPLHVGDLMRDTAHLSHDQFGAFMRLVLVHFSFGEAGIPENRLHHYARVSAKVWARKYSESLMPLFDRAGGNVVLPKLVNTLRELNARVSAQRDKALKRWEGVDAAALPAESHPPESKNEVREAFLYEQFPGVMTASEFTDALPQKWQVIAESFGIEKEFLPAVAAGFWERFVGRYPDDPNCQEKFPAKKNWEKAWEYECDRLDRVRRGLPKRNDLPMQKKPLVKGMW